MIDWRKVKEGDYIITSNKKDRLDDFLFIVEKKRPVTLKNCKTGNKKRLYNLWIYEKRIARIVPKEEIDLMNLGK